MVLSNGLVTSAIAANEIHWTEQREEFAGISAWSLLHFILETAPLVLFLGTKGTAIHERDSWQYIGRDCGAGSGAALIKVLWGRMVGIGVVKGE